MLKQVQDLSLAGWFKEQVVPIETRKDFWVGNFVSNCVPPIYPAYCKIFHNIYEDESIADRTLTWDQEAKSTKRPSEEPVEKLINEATRVYGGEVRSEAARRLSWRSLAERYGLSFHAELTAETFTRNFPGRSWPRYIIGPEEGLLEFDSAREVVRSIATARSDFGAEQLCYFHYDLIATLGYESDLLFEGKLIDVFATYNLESVHGSPTQWWPEDRGWFVCSDWDLTFTLVGGSEEIIDELISNLDLEAVRVEPTFRIDNQSDQINP